MDDTRVIENKKRVQVQVQVHSLSKGVLEHKFHTQGRVGGPVQEAENLFLTSKFWPILAQIGQIKTIQNPPWAQECVSKAYNLTIFHICTAWNQMSHRVTYIIICVMMWHIIILYIILYSRNHVIKTYHIWTKHTLFRRRGGRGFAEALNKQLWPYVRFSRSDTPLMFCSHTMIT